MVIAFCVVACLAVQDPALILNSAAELRAPAPVTCGLVEGALDAKVPWRAVRLRGDGGIVVPGVLVHSGGGSAVRMVLSGLHPGDTPLWLDRGTPAELPRAAVVIGDGAAAYESEGWAVAFEPDGTTVVGDCVCRLHPRAPRDGAWREWDRDPLRTVLVWEAPMTALYAILWAGVREVELTLVLRGATGSLPPALGLEIAPAPEPELPPEPPSEGPASDPPSSDVPDGSPFERVMEDLRSSPWELLAPGGSPVVAAVRRQGPTAPLSIEGVPGRTRRLMAVDGAEGLPPGELRVLRLRLADGLAPAFSFARPARFAGTWPGGVRFGPPSRCHDLVRLVGKLDAALAVFRTDPRHGLLHRREDLGDWRMDGFRYGNLEWDTSLGFLLLFIDRGDRIDAWQAVLGVEHLLLRDRDPRTGLFFQHGREHQSGLLEPGHHWAEGVAAVAAWLGDPWITDEARRLAQDQIAAFGRLDLLSELPRSLGWALTALCALHEVAPDQGASAKVIAKLERFVLSRQTDSGHFTLERSTTHENGFRVSPFVDGGILLPALERASRITRNPRTGEALRRAREALLRDAIVVDADGPALVSSIIIEDRGGRRISRAGRAEGEEVALFLSGMAGPGADGAMSGLVRRAETTLALDSRTYLGKGISMLMRALPAYAGRRGVR